jgi:hypothetical protein
METKLKKVHRNFKLPEELDTEIRNKSVMLGMNQTAVLEHALRFYFKTGMAQDLASRAGELKKMAKRLKSSFNYPLHRLAAALA